jgi:O-antigen/teichoic acid export membrane protein
VSGIEPGSSVRGQSVPEVDILDTAAAGPTAIRGGVLRTAGFVGGLLLALASAPLLVRHLGDAEFGRYSAVLAVIMIVAGLTEGGVNTVALRELSATTDPGDRNRLMGDLLGLRLILSAVGVGVAVGFSVVAGYGGDLVLGTFLAGLGLVAAMTQTLVATVLQSRLRFGWAALIELARQAVSTGLIVVLVLAGSGVVAFLAIAIPAGLGSLAFTVLLVRGTITLRPAFHPRRWVPLLRDTAVFALAIAVNTLYFRITLVIMSLVATASETGHFAISFRVMEVLVAVPVLLIGGAFPIISRAARSERFDFSAGRTFELGVYAGALAAVCLVLSAPFAIEVLVGRSDHPSVVVLQIQSVAIIASFIAVATGYPLLGMRRHRETLIANCASLLVVVILALALTPEWGARGAAIAAVIADFTLAGANAVFLVRQGGPRLPLTSLGVALLAGLCGYVVGTFVGIHPLIEAAAGGAIFLAVLALLGRFPPEVREVLRRPATSR